MNISTNKIELIEEVYYTVLDSEIEIDLFLKDGDGEYIKKIKSRKLNN